MGPIFLGIVGFGLVALFLGLFARGGPRESARAAHAPQFGVDRLAAMTRDFLGRMGLAVTSVELRGGGRVDVLAQDTRPGVGQSLYVRVMSIAEPVGTAEVQAALDRLKGESLNKALIVSDTGFSDEARASAVDSAVELMDGSALEQALARPLERPPPALTPSEA